VKRRINRILIVLLAVGALSACDTGESNNGRGIIGGSGDGGNNNGTDAGDTDPGDGTDDGATTDDGGGDGADGCQPETDQEMCERLDFECGELTDLDNCGNERTVDSCGDESQVCDEFQTCGGGGTEGQCGCTQTSCEAAGVLCGEIDDTCGGTLQCDAFCVDSIGSGANHNCAVGSGKIKCWGSGRDGQLGTGSTSNAKNPADVIGLNNDVRQVGPGSAHTCVLNNAEQILCWGENSRSQLGLGTTVGTNKATNPAISDNATEVVSGRVHSCALVNGGVQCWGGNDRGQLGDPSFQYTADVGLPNEVPSLNSGVTQLAAGKDHTCALMDSGEVRCWGDGRAGQLGNVIAPYLDTFSGIDDSTLAYGFQDGSADGFYREPVTIQGPDGSGTLSDVVQISAGAAHTCAVTSDNKLYCWGAMGDGLDCPDNFDHCTAFPDGQTPATSSAPTGLFRENSPNRINVKRYTNVQLDPWQVDPGLPVEEVSSGAHHICMRVTEPDSSKTNVYCTGRNIHGQVGDGSTNKWSTPQPIATDDVSGNIVRATQLALGGEHSCALADNNNVKCWGSNEDGQVGNSDLERDESYRPYDVKLNQTN
jgi:hypothetical protein